MRKSDSFVKNRETEILHYIKETGGIQIETICEKHGLSQSAARALLNAMSEKKLLKRIRGRAVMLAPNVNSALEYNIRDNISNLKEKQAIAREALSLIKENDIVCLCGGSTTYLLAKELRNFGKLTLVTNSVWVANELIDNANINIRMCGGVLNNVKGSLNGPTAEEYFDNVYIDKAIFGADSVNLDFGIMSVDSITSHLERKILTKAKEAIILCDHTKFNKFTAIDNVASFHEMDYIVTDSGIDSRTLNVINFAGVSVKVGQVK